MNQVKTSKKNSVIVEPNPTAPPQKKGGKGKGKAPPKNNIMVPVNTTPLEEKSGGRGSQSARAGLQFAVPRVARFMKQGRYADRIGGGAPVYLASALQYICSEILELAGNECEIAKRQRIVPRHIMLGIKNDSELNKLLGKNCDFSESGVVPNIHKSILPGKKGKGKAMDDDIHMDNDEE
jgi:histone H2A